MRFSAKGAAFIIHKPGATPQGHVIGPKMHLALKARFSADGHLFHRRNDARPTRLKRAFSAGDFGISMKPGASPQAPD